MPIRFCTLSRVVTVCALIAAACPAAAFAHAHLRSAQPAVDGTVPAGVAEIRIIYTEGVEPRFCQVQVTGPGGAPIAAASPQVDPADNKVLVLRFAQPLTPGSYKVEWHATAVDTHKTEGTYGFTVVP